MGGFDTLCRAKQREFSDYLSTQANAAVDYAFGNDKLKYASGLLRSEYNLKIDVSKALEDKSATNTYGNYIKDGKMNEVMAIQEYMKTAGAKGKNVNQIKIEDLKVAENLNAYDKAIKETTDSQIDRNKELEPNNIAMIAKRSMATKDSNNLIDKRQKLTNIHLFKGRYYKIILKFIRVTKCKLVSFNYKIAVIIVIVIIGIIVCKIFVIQK